jgi:MSHA biogenesis protein MshK
MAGGMNHKVKGSRQKAAGLSSFSLHPSSFAFAFCCAMGAATGVHAQVLTDPTRPPVEAYTGAVAESGGAPPAALLQSVMITPTERSAIIGGEWVKLGGKYREARVVKITESEVVLHSANGSEILRMYPDVSMKPVEPERPAGKKPAAKIRGPAATTRRKQG